MLKDIVVLGVGTFFDLGATMMSVAAPLYFPNAPRWIACKKIDALVVLPFNSDELTDPARAVKKRGTFITVVDRGLKDPSIQDIYVAGNNPEFGRVASKYMADNLKSGNVVVFRGIPTVIDEERVSNLAREGAEFIAGHIIRVTEKAFDDFAAGGADEAANRRMLGLEHKATE